MVSWIFHVAFQHIRNNPFRTLLTGIGVALGVAFATSLLLAADSVQMSLNKQVESNYGSYDVQFGYRKSGQYLKDEEIQKVANLYGVQSVSKVLIPYMVPFPEEIYRQPAYWAVEEGSPEMAIFRVIEGRYPKKGAEVALTAAYASRKGIKVGDKITFPFPPYGEKTVEVCGILEPPISRSGGNTAFFPLSWMQETVQESNNINLVLVEFKGNKSYFAEQIKLINPDLKIDTRQYKDEAYKRFNHFKPITLVLGIISLLVGAVLVMGSFVLSVRSRSHQWATLQALGSTSIGIISIVLHEALLIGVLGSAVGVFVGMGLSSLIASFINDLVQISGGVEVVWSPMILLLVFLFGVLLSIFGAIAPALIARKVPPAQALRPGLQSNKKLEKKSNSWGMFLIALGLITAFGNNLVLTDSNTEQIVSTVGGLIMTIGLLIAIPQIFVWFVLLLAFPMRTFFGVEAMLATRNVIRYRRRSGFSVAILAFALTISLASQIFIDNMQNGIENNLRKQFPADFVVRIASAAYDSEINPEMADKIAAIEGIDKLAPIATPQTAKLIDYDFRKASETWLRFMDIEGDPFERDNIEILPASTIALKEILSLEVVEGYNLTTDLRPNEAIIVEDKAKNLGVKPGDVLYVRPLMGETQPIMIKSILKNYPMVRGNSYLFVNLEWGMNVFGSTGYQILHVKTNQGSELMQIEHKVKSIIADLKDAEYVSIQNQIMDQKAFFNQQLFLIRSLIIVVLLIAGIALINAIMSSLYDRRFELSVIQAVGATQGQIMRIVLIEGMLMGIGGGLIGSLGGLLIAYVLLSMIEFSTSTIVIPWNVIGVLVGISVLISMLSSAITVRWVKRLSPTQVMRVY